MSALSADPAKTSSLAAIDLRLAVVEPEVFRGRPRSDQGVCRSWAARAVCKRVLGSSRLPASGGSEPDGGVALPRSARLAARVHQDARGSRAARTRTCRASSSAAWPTPVDPEQSGGIECRNDRRAEAVRRQGSRLRRHASTFPTCSRSPPSTRTGRDMAAASAITWSTASIPRTTQRSPRCFSRAASSADAICRRSNRSIRSKVTEYVAHSWYQYQQGDARGAPSFQRGDAAELHRSQASVRAARHRSGQKYSWLKSPRYDERADGGRSACAHARRICVRATRE